MRYASIVKKLDKIHFHYLVLSSLFPAIGYFVCGLLGVYWLIGYTNDDLELTVLRQSSFFWGYALSRIYQPQPAK